MEEMIMPKRSKKLPHILKDLEDVTCYIEASAAGSSVKLMVASGLPRDMERDRVTARPRVLSLPRRRSVRRRPWEWLDYTLTRSNPRYIPLTTVEEEPQKLGETKTELLSTT
ncbi:MAG: hypothetical protein HXS52_13285 [Theionarchaea archaeon]|nr:hypothetical protein [Theionarchaea archaeon]MBU7038899.1 hypothetical protein [Theionarchaea archaeon]